MPEISIIIPVFNVERYLRKCLDSLLAQTFSDFEIICVDDSSTDKSVEILEEYALRDNRITVLKQEHSGAGEARNLGMDKARGKYLQFLDSDDFFEPNMLDQLYSRAKKFDADLVVCSSKKVDEEGNFLETIRTNFTLNKQLVQYDKPFCRRDYPEDIFILFNLTPWNKLVLREMVLRNNLRFQNLSSCNDVYFGYMVKVLAKRIVVCNKELVNYRIRAGAISKTRGDSASNIIKAAICVKKQLEKMGLFEELESAYFKAVRRNIKYELSQCNYWQYKKFLSEARNLLGDDIRKYSAYLKKDDITLEYLNNFIGEKKVLLWGASLFIKDVLDDEAARNPNILGFVDKNPERWGSLWCGYKIYSPDVINEMKPDGVLLTVFSNNEDLYETLREVFVKEYKGVELLPNIFVEE